MKVGKDYFAENKSSFLSTDKDLALIIDKILGNQKLLKLLYYSQKDCLEAPNLTATQKLSLIDKQIRIVPKLDISSECPNFIIITMDNFRPNETNPEFRDCHIIIDILCHPNHQNLGNFKLRHNAIAGELDAMLNEQKLTGIGTLNFVGGRRLVLNDQLMGLTLIYDAVHGIEDKINPLS